MVEFGFHSRFGSTMPARPTPNFFSAARRVTDWARPLVSSSNLLFMFFLSFVLSYGIASASYWAPACADTPSWVAGRSRSHPVVLALFVTAAGIERRVAPFR